VGAAEGDAEGFADALAQARQVCRVAPLTVRPDTVHYRADLFAELGVSRVPPVDEWLRDVGQRLTAGPHLVATLDAFYRNKMTRTLTAASLGIHPRTLDYRLNRVRELTGLDPVSVRGVRILSTTVTRVLAGAWT
jgi:sugar diacid utilization regulator